MLISLIAINPLFCSAHAAKFNCNFLNDGASVKTCTIDSDSAGNYCQFDYSASIKGSCFGVPFFSPDVVILACAFHDPALKPWEVARGTGDRSKPSLTVTASPGFLSLGGAVVKPPEAYIGAAYLEKAGAARLEANCSTP
ncbi:hypothetical protein [Bradyrhizobium sp. CCBAU 25338]|uniref:hypothetical protein n=1 Tax=Bradyrhizobium sp. CCBAU 25338 TaxID=1641877 RepID=UPI002302A688|nr:hypothetical protein [Bradyrhizobium sp. CCBAU 25338]